MSKIILGFIAFLGLVSFPVYSENVSGVILPAKQADLSFTRSGKILSMKSEGDFVKTGDVIATLDREEALISLEAAEVGYNMAVLAVKIAEHDRDKKVRLTGEDILSEIAVTEAEFEVKNAKEQVKLAKTDLESARLMLDACELKAPFDGVVVSTELRVNEYASPGTTLLNLASLQDLTVTVDIPVELSQSLKEGIASSYKISGKVKGQVTVKKMMPLIDPASGLRRIVWQVDPNNRADLVSGRHITISPW